MLHIIYRSYGGENQKGRPTYYSKLLALASLVSAFHELDAGEAEIVFLNDGPIPSERLRLMEQSGEVVARANLGMLGSMRTALGLPAQRGWADSDLVWFAEDDYLYRPDALTGLTGAARAFPEADYFALYALIGHRLPNGTAPEDGRVPAEWSDSTPRLVDGHPWRRALSTTSTFGGRVRALLEDRAMMHAAMWSGGAWDHTTCLIYQGFLPYPLQSMRQTLRGASGPRDWLRRAAIATARAGLNGYQAARARSGQRGRWLVAPDPALITHLETEYLAQGTDWAAVARRIQYGADADEHEKSA